jgi:hypothetical protein
VLRASAVQNRNRGPATAASILLIALVAVGGCSAAPVGATRPPSPTQSPTQSPTPDATGSIPPTGSAVSPTPAAPALSAAAAAAPCLDGSTAGTFLRASGTRITCDGRPVELTGFTFYPSLLGGAKAWHDPSFPAYIDHVLDMGVAAGQNLIRATDQWDSHTSGQTADDPVVWSNMDHLMAAARERGVFVVVDLSAFRWLLTSQGSDPSRADLWVPFIDQVAARYRDNPAVAFYSIAGEPKPPATPADLRSLTDFYRTTSEALRAADPNHLITLGGFNHMEDHPELNWWQSLDQLATNDIVAVKTYSQHDLNLMPAIAAYARSAGKPVVDEEFGMPQSYGDGTFAGGAAYNGLAGGRAAFFEAVYSSGSELGYAGFVFWNMGCEIGPTSYEVSPQTPAVWAVVAGHGAVPRAAAALASVPLLCG